MKGDWFIYQTIMMIMVMRNDNEDCNDCDIDGEDEGEENNE